jgi:hypothetical protein
MQDASGSSGEGKVLHRGLLGPQDAKFAAMGEEYVAVGIVLHSAFAPFKI